MYFHMWNIWSVSCWCGLVTVLCEHFFSCTAECSLPWFTLSERFSVARQTIPYYLEPHWSNSINTQQSTWIIVEQASVVCDIWSGEQQKSTVNLYCFQKEQGDKAFQWIGHNMFPEESTFVCLISLRQLGKFYQIEFAMKAWSSHQDRSYR